MAALWVVLGGLWSCQTSEYPAPVLGSTYRIEEDRKDEQSEMIIDILTTDYECANAQIDELDLCRPKVDRANAEVHVSFVLRDPTSLQTVPVALSADQVEVEHARSPQANMELIPHNPRSAGQLFIVVIDGSSSMNLIDGNGTARRIDRVKQALRSQKVLDAFYPPGDTSTAVVLMMFTDQLRPLDGETVKVIRAKKEYLRQIDEYLEPRGGFTHLYGAVRESTTKLLREPEVAEFLGARAAQATTIVLTDGFNNQEASDTCGDNVLRLTKTLEVVRQARAKNSTVKPILYMVGLGSKYRNGEKPESTTVTPSRANLCGKYADDRIDGLLENQGIDHVSLSWLAEAGGGKSYVKKKSKDLAKVFADAAAKRYQWFELRYRVIDPMWHRQSFETRVELRQSYRAGTTVTFLPNPWIDGPTASVPPGGRWMQLTPIRHAFTLLMPILGALVFLSFVGAAFFNATRAVFRRARPRK
ncbi:MAG: VWA domain-containing protein [Alphaproteobacteria bacterium]|nr:VWA domain-containing protein [Alphaproteobacteria bacterium]MCB9691375.1 VWA domain-containing protein [Alphaproteobacteria bacterium]